MSLTQAPPLKRRQLLKSHITNEPMDVVVEAIAHKARQRESAYVCLTNSHMLVEAHQDPQFAEVVNNAFIATPDGKPLAVVMNLLYKTRQTQIAGMELTMALMALAAQQNLGVFF